MTSPNSSSSCPTEGHTNPAEDTKLNEAFSNTYFCDLNKFRGLGETPVYHQPVLDNDRPRFWPLDKYKSAPQDLGYNDFFATSWKGLRLLKDPETQSAYHNLLWELKPKTIIELGVYSGGSLVWFRDLAKSFGLNSTIIGVDFDLSRCQIRHDDMDNIKLIEGDSNHPEKLDFGELQHPILFIDDAHCNTFNVLKHLLLCQVLKLGDYFVIEDTMPLWKRYSPTLLQSHLNSFRNVMTLDLLYSNACAQLKDGVFKIK